MPNYRKNPQALSALSPEQYRVTQRDGTERPFDNEYWDNKEPGIYVDVVSGEPLFASVNKFDSSWVGPASRSRLIAENVVENHRCQSWHDREPKSAQAHGDSHLGHVFSRWAAARRVVCVTASIPHLCASFPLDDLESEGYGKLPQAVRCPRRGGTT